MTKDAEIILPGGLINQVTRIGDTVRRTMLWDRAVQHQLLLHLQAQGFAAAPRFLGFDEQGREILTYLPGTVPVGVSGFTDAQLTSAAQLLRRYHDATVTFPLVRERGAEVMCHNDWTPANTVLFDNLPAGMIDFDTAAPGTRLWDVVFSIWTWLDLGDTDYSAAEQIRRIVLFCDAYDHPSCTLLNVAGYLPARQAGVARWAEQRGMADGALWARQCLNWTLQHITEPIHPSGRPE